MLTCNDDKKSNRFQIFWCKFSRINFFSSKERKKERKKEIQDLQQESDFLKQEIEKQQKFERTNYVANKILEPVLNISEHSVFIPFYEKILNGEDLQFIEKNEDIYLQSDSNIQILFEGKNLTKNLNLEMLKNNYTKILKLSVSEMVDFLNSQKNYLHNYLQLKNLQKKDNNNFLYFAPALQDLQNCKISKNSIKDNIAKNRFIYINIKVQNRTFQLRLWDKEFYFSEEFAEKSKYFSNINSIQSANIFLKNVEKDPNFTIEEKN